MQNKFLSFIVLSIIAIFLFISLKSTWLFTVDDAYIGMRYSQHLAEGYGLAWNIGEAPLEGYSNFSYILLGTLLYYFHLPVIEIIRCFSLFFSLLTCIVMYRTMRLWVSSSLALLPIFLLISYPGFMLWTVSGLETPLFMLLIVSSVYYLLHQRYGLAGALMAIAGLTRPEAPLFFIVFGLILFCATEGSFKKKLRSIIPYILAFSCIYIPYFLFRIIYFGRLFPNPIYCKFMNGDSHLALMTEYFKLLCPLLALSLPLWLTKKTPILFYYTLISALVCFLMLYGVDPIMGVYNRYALPFLTLLMMTGILGLQQATQYFPERFRKNHYVVLLALLFTLLLSLFQPSFKTTQEMTHSYYLKNEMRLALSHWLEKHMTETPLPHSVVIGDCGIIPHFLNHATIIDSYCLNSLEMTRPPINKSYPKFINWLFNQSKPSYIILTRFKWHHHFIKYPFEGTIDHDPRFKKNYHFIKQFYLNHSFIPYQYNIYQRNTIGENHDASAPPSSK